MKRTRIFTCFAMVALSQCGVLDSGQAVASSDEVTNWVFCTNNMWGSQRANAENAVKNVPVSDWDRMSPKDSSDKTRLENLAQVCIENNYNPKQYLTQLFNWWVFREGSRLPKFNLFFPESVKYLLSLVESPLYVAHVMHNRTASHWRQSLRQFTFNISQDQIQRLASAVARHTVFIDQQSQVQRLEQRVSELEASLSNQTETIAILQSQQADSLKQQQELQKSFETSQKQNQELRGLFVAFQKQHAEEMSKLQSQIDAHEQRITTIQQCLTGFTNVSESTNQLVSVANEMKLSNDNAGEITKLHQQIEELSKKFAEVQQTLPQSALDGVNVRLGTLSANVDVLTTFIKPDQLPDGWIQKNGIAKMLHTLIPMIKSIDQVLKNSDHVSAYKEAFEVQLQRLNSNAK